MISKTNHIFYYNFKQHELPLNSFGDFRSLMRLPYKNLLRKSSKPKFEIINNWSILNTSCRFWTSDVIFTQLYVTPCPKFKFVPPKLPLCAFRGIGILIFSCDDCPTGFYWYFSRGLSLGRRVEFEKKKGLSVSLIHLVTSVIGYENLLWYFILINMTNQ